MCAVQGKNQALADAGAIVPDSFEDFEGAIAKTFKRLVDDKIIVPQPNVEAAAIPLDLEAAKKAGKVRLSQPGYQSLMSAHAASQDHSRCLINLAFLFQFKQTRVIVTFRFHKD